VAVTENGTPQTVQILSNDDNEYGGTAIVWDMPFAPAPQPGLQTVYTVNIGNVLINGTPQSFSYTTTSFDPTTTTALAPVPAEVEFLQPAAQVSASTSSIVIEVARSMNAAQQVSVDYATSNGTALAGTNYLATSGTLTFAPGQFFSQIVVPIVASDSQTAGGTFSISLYLPDEASIGPLSTVEVTITGASGDSTPPQSGTGNPIVEPVQPDPPIVLGVLDLVQTTDAGHTRQSRPGAARLVGFQLTFNDPLDARSATARRNYTLVQYEARGRGVVAQAVPIRVSYDPTGDTVNLILTGEHPFRLGGRLALNPSAPTGISDASGAFLTGNTTFTIQPRAKSIVP
jgi:hypothetical protein